MTPSRFLLSVCLLFLVGVFLRQFIDLIWWPLMLLPLAVALTTKRIVWVFILFFLFLGFLRPVNPEPLTGTEWSGRVVSQPEAREKSVGFTVRTDKKDIRVYARPYTLVDYGDEVILRGKPTEDLLLYPSVEVVEKNPHFFFRFKSWLEERIRRNMPLPQASFLESMVLGNRHLLSSKWQEVLNRSGLRHVTAVSGMHVTILISTSIALFLGMGFHRRYAFYLALVLITVFVVLTGAQPSALRAGLMGGLYLLARHLGREGSAVRLLILAAAVLVAFNPTLLTSVGFQLSFTAVLGIIYLSPKIKLPEVLSISISAYLATLPLILYHFQQASLFAILANVLVVPVIYWIMISGFLGVILGGVFLWPSFLLLSYFLLVASIFSILPIIFISGWWILLLYIPLVVWATFPKPSFLLKYS